MTEADHLKNQIAADVAELRIMAGEYQHGSIVRLAFVGFATMLADEFALSGDTDRIDLVLRVLKSVQPCTPAELIDRMNFPRPESSRLINAAISQGLIDTDETPTAGRPRVLLRIPESADSQT